MSESLIPQFDRKQFALKHSPNGCINKENVHTVQNGKSKTEGKNDGGSAKKKGMLLNGENRAVTSVQGRSPSRSPVTKFQIYSDDNDVRSRPRVRKGVCRKKIRARQDSSRDAADSRAVLHRSRSSSNSCKISSGKNNRRARSETRNQLSSPHYYLTRLPKFDDAKVKYLSQRTASSVKVHVDKMRKHNNNVNENGGAIGRALQSQKSPGSMTDMNDAYLDDQIYEPNILHIQRQRDQQSPRLFTNFLRENVNEEQRRLTVEHIIHVGVQSNYSSGVIYQTVKLFNVAINRILVASGDIKLLSLACLWIILKQEVLDHKIPSTTRILQYGLYINREKCLLEFEERILLATNFNPKFADPFIILYYYIYNSESVLKSNIWKTKSCGIYMIDISMLDASLCDIPTHVIAIAAMELSLHLVYSSDVNVVEAWYQVRRSKQWVAEWEESSVNFTKRMIFYTLKQDKFSSNVIYKKHMHRKNGKIAAFIYEKINTTAYYCIDEANFNLEK